MARDADGLRRMFLTQAELMRRCAAEPGEYPVIRRKVGTAEHPVPEVPLDFLAERLEIRRGVDCLGDDKSQAALDLARCWS